MAPKEGSDDNRYFPEPDLVHLAPDDAMRARPPRRCPSSPPPGGPGWCATGGIGDHDARVLVDDRALAGYAEAAVRRRGAGREVANWCTGEILGYLNETGLSAEVLPAGARRPGRAGGPRRRGHGSRASRPRTCWPSACASRSGPAGWWRSAGLAQVSDEAELAAVVERVPRRAPRRRRGPTAPATTRPAKKKRGFFMGELMKGHRGSGNPQLLQTGSSTTAWHADRPGTSADDGSGTGLSSPP